MNKALVVIISLGQNCNIIDEHRTEFKDIRKGSGLYILFEYSVKVECMLKIVKDI